MKRAIVFIDGSNFYYRLKHIIKRGLNNASLLDFNYQKFCFWLCKDFEVVEMRYYIGVVRRKNNDQKSEKLYNDQQRLFRKLQKHNVKIVLGMLIQHPDKTYHEKGVDVRLAVEMIKLAREDKYDTAFLISSDTDLVPAVEEILLLGKKVKYIGATDSQSFGLSKITRDYLILRPEDVELFLK
ncbi:MAG: NYN domain-containing protein [bacterium]|nr:NYN domain-containing protein [bacterium]